jgi:hypothetical protein
MTVKRGWAFNHPSANLPKSSGDGASGPSRIDPMLGTVNDDYRPQEPDVSPPRQSTNGGLSGDPVRTGVDQWHANSAQYGNVRNTDGASSFAVTGTDAPLLDGTPPSQDSNLSSTTVVGGQGGSAKTFRTRQDGGDLDWQLAEGFGGRPAGL